MRAAAVREAAVREAAVREAAVREAAGGRVEGELQKPACGPRCIECCTSPAKRSRFGMAGRCGHLQEME